MYSYLAIFLLGWIAAGLVNYLSDYLPTERKLVRPYCWNCRKPYSLLTYVLLPLRCPHCQRGRRWRAWLMYPIYFLITFGLWRYYRPELGFVLSWLLCIYFGVVVVIDLEHRLILHMVSLFGVLLGLWSGWALRGVLLTLAGGVAGFVIMYVLYIGGKWFLRLLSRRRRYNEVDEALGFGDVALGGVVGLMLGWPGIVAGLMLAVLLGGLASLIYLAILLFRHQDHRNATIAYGPYLAVSALILIFLRELLYQLF